MLSRESGESVGEYSIAQGTLAASKNYSLTFEGSQLDVIPAVLTIAVADKKITLGDLLPGEFEFIYDGLVNGDNAEVVTGLLATYSCGECKEAGQYEILLSGALAANYQIAYRNGALAVEKPLGLRYRRSMKSHSVRAPVWDLLGRKR